MPIISSDVVRVVFYEAENVRLAMKYLEDKDRCVLIMDATFKTNTQELVLAGLGISVPHVDRNVVRNSSAMQPKGSATQNSATTS